MNVLDLFSGIGGFSLGLERTGGFRTVAFCEVAPFPRRVLAHHWPEVPCYDDVRTLTARELGADGVASPDVLCGGFPCQDLSNAGTGKGLDGARSGLWREIARLVGELRPRYVIVENSPRLLDRHRGAAFRRVLGDLAALRYDAEWHCLPAAGLGAPHVRDRVWILAYPNGLHGQAGMGVLHHHAPALQAIRDENRAGLWLASSRPPAGMDDGLPGELDRRERTECLGNAVVPQIPELIGRAILAAEDARLRVAA